MKTAPVMLILMAATLPSISMPAAAQNQYQQSGSTGGGIYYAPGTSMGGGIVYPARVPYQNQPGYGYYAPNAYAPGYPAYGYGATGYGLPIYGAPVQGAGGYFQFGRGTGRGAFYWKSPSGYYYPWGGAAAYGATAPIIIVQQGESKVAQPPISDMYKDIRAYLEEQNTKAKFLAEDYNHLSRRLRDIMQKESLLANRNGGSLDSVDEESIRKDLNMLSGDIARRVKP